LTKNTKHNQSHQKRHGNYLPLAKKLKGLFLGGAQLRKKDTTFFAKHGQTKGPDVAIKGTCQAATTQHRKGGGLQFTWAGMENENCTNGESDAKQTCKGKPAQLL